MSEPVDLEELNRVAGHCEETNYPNGAKITDIAITEIKELREKNKKLIDGVADQAIELAKMGGILQLLKEDPENLPDEIAEQCCLMDDPVHFHHDGCPSEDGELNELHVRIFHLENALKDRICICRECGKSFVGDSP